MRTNETKKVADLLKQIEPTFNNNNNIVNNENEINRTHFWRDFKYTFAKKFNKKFIQDKRAIINLKVLFHYFLQEEKFFECENLRKDISVPSFHKGILIVGGYGLGKTDYFKVFETLFQKYNNLRFKYYTSKKLVQDYENCQTPLDKSSFFLEKERRLMFIDDVNSEREASNYGKVDVIGEILYQRYDNRLKTHIACNYSNSKNCAVRTLEDLGGRYGPRIYDRIFEMFNVVEFKGKSYR